MGGYSWRFWSRKPLSVATDGAGNTKGRHGWAAKRFEVVMLPGFNCIFYYQPEVVVQAIMTYAMRKVFFESLIKTISLFKHQTVYVKKWAPVVHVFVLEDE